MCDFQIRLDRILNGLTDAGEECLIVSLSPCDRDTLGRDSTSGLETNLTLSGTKYAYRGWQILIALGDPSHVAYAEAGKTRYSKAYI